MSRLSQLAVSKRSVTLLLAGALFIAGISAWGSLKQELLPDIEFPVITVIAPYPGAGAADVADQVAVPIERAISGVPRLETVQSTSANSIALVIAQFEFGTDVKEALAAIEEGIADAGLPDGVDPTARPSTSTPRRSSSRRSARPRRTAWRPPPRSPGPRSCRRSPPSTASRRPTSPVASSSGLIDHARPRQAGRGRRVGRPDHRRPARPTT